MAAAGNYLPPTHPPTQQQTAAAATRDKLRVPIDVVRSDTNK